MARKWKIDKILVSGLAIFAIGVILVASSLGSILGPAVSSRTTFKEINTNEYKSPNITLNSNSVLYVINVTKNFYLIPASDVSNVTPGNIASYALSPVHGGQVTVGGVTYGSGQNSTLYANISGKYTIISFSTTYPEISFSKMEPDAFAIIGSASLGGIMVLVSIPTVIFGAIRQIRMMKEKKDLEDIMNM